MAPSEQVELRAKFLQEAAHSLVVSSPAVSAFLGTARSNLIEDANLELPSKERDAFRREFCGACGNSMVPGWSCTVSVCSQLEQQGRKLKARSKESTKFDKSAVYICLRCHRETAQALQPKPSRSLSKSKGRTESKPTADTTKATTGDKVVKSINASSKQRQKARRGGLQAMLEKTKTQTSSQGGFDLMDFAM